jgi:hypothetical protein
MAAVVIVVRGVELEVEAAGSWTHSRDIRRAGVILFLKISCPSF